MKRKNKLLVVEDDPLNQTIYSAIFSKDYDLKICSDDQDFYKELNDNVFDLFIIDLGLNSGKNGIDLIEELREMAKYAVTPIIVITAFSRKIDKENALAAGCTLFISKPFDIKELAIEVDKYLK